MKERPILFSGSMVRALLSGAKTQTRRVVKPQPYDGARLTVEYYHPVVIDRHGDEQPGAEIFGAYDSEGEWGAKCPYCVPGDRLWVRETFSYSSSLPVSMRKGQASRRHIWYWADGNPAHGDWTRPKPSIHMPRWASRLTLEVTGVRVERVQEITAADCLAEGIVSRGYYPHGLPPATAQLYVEDFAGLWANINGPNSWDENPWVWVIEFKPEEAPRG